MKWYLGALALLVVAIIFQWGLLAYAMYVLLGVLLVSRWLANAWIKQAAAERSCSAEQVEAGDEVTVDVRIRNTGSLPIAWLLVEDVLPRTALLQRPPRLSVVGQRMGLFLLRAGQVERLRYKIEFAMRGYYQLGPLVMETGDLFGLHRRFVVATEPLFVLVLPRLIPLPSYDLASRRPIGEVRLTHRLYEDPTRISGVREYQAGDPLNRVHWKASARTSKLHSKTYEPSCLAGATILLDFHASGYPRKHEPLRSELAITAAASLAHAVYQLGQQIGLVSNGRDAADRIREEGWNREHRNRLLAESAGAMREQSDRLRPVTVQNGRGPEQFQQIREALARLELTDGLPLEQLVLEAGPRLPRDATVIAIVGEVSAAGALALGNLRRQGLAVTAVVCAMDEHEREQSGGRLLAEGIETRFIQDEASLAALCERQMVLA